MRRRAWGGRRSRGVVGGQAPDSTQVWMWVAQEGGSAWVQWGKEAGVNAHTNATRPRLSYKAARPCDDF